MQSPTATPSRRRAAALAALVALALVSPMGPAARAGYIFHVVADTSALPAATTGYLDFQFNPGGPGADTSTATVSNFTSTAIALGTATPSGGGSGALPGTVVITNSAAFNEVLQGATFGSGSGFSFDLDLSGPAVDSPTPGNPVGTTFGLGILDSMFNPFPQFGNADPVLRIDLIGGSGTPGVSEAVNPPIVSVTPQAGAVPAPSALVLAAIGVAVCGGRCLRRRR